MESQAERGLSQDLPSNDTAVIHLSYERTFVRKEVPTMSGTGRRLRASKGDVQERTEPPRSGAARVTGDGGHGARAGRALVDEQIALSPHARARSRKLLRPSLGPGC